MAAGAGADGGYGIGPTAERLISNESINEIRLGWATRLLARVVFRFARAAVGDREAAVGIRNHFEVSAVSAAAFRVGDHGFGTIVRRVRSFSGVQHVKVLQARAVMNRLPGFRTAGFVRAVVHDGHARTNRIDNGPRIRQVHAVVRDQIEIDRRDGIVRAHQRDLLGLGEVAEIEETEFSVSHENPGRARVLAGIGFGLDLVSAVGIVLRFHSGDVVDMLAIGRKDDNAEPGHVDSVARTHNTPFFARDGAEVGAVIVAGGVGVLPILAMIQELSDGHALCDQLGYAADMVHVIVGDQQMIDIGDAGVAHGGPNAIGVAALIAWPACVD